MPRKPRLLTQSGVYHIMARGNNRQLLFHKPADYGYYLWLLKNLKKEHIFDIYHYCLMPNHVHFLMRFQDREALSRVMQRTNLGYAKKYRKEYDSCGHVFQDRFKSLAVNDDSYLLDCGRYIERNPVTAKLVESPEAYRWTSYRFYAFGDYDSLLTQNPLYDGLGRNEKTRRLAYRKLITAGQPYEALISTGLAQM